MKIRDIDSSIKKINKYVLLVICFIICLILGGVGFYIGNEFSLSVFYVIPVIIAAWYSSKKTAIIISAFAVLTWLAGDLLAGRSYSVFLIPYINSVGRLILFLIVAFLVLTVRKHLSEQTLSANEDFLTKISNSRAFFNYARMEFARLERYKEPFTVAYFDVDNFKAVNDIYGHNSGDKVLTDIAYTIRRNIRPTDMVARIGGDEFAILLIKTDPYQAKIIVKKINNLLNNLMRKEKHEVTFSFGVVTFLRKPDSIDAMIKKADDIMYIAKRNGKNRINYFVYK